MIYLAGTDFTHLTNNELINGIKALNLPDYIRSKAYGIDVRETLAQMTEMTIQLGVNMGLSPDDALNWARKLQETVSQSEFDSWVATLLDGGPSIFMNTLSELQSTYPNGASGVALVRETDPAKIYVWNGTAWEDFGDYQGIEIKDKSITEVKLSNDAVKPRIVDSKIERKLDILEGDLPTTPTGLKENATKNIVGTSTLNFIYLNKSDAKFFDLNTYGFIFKTTVTDETMTNNFRGSTRDLSGSVISAYPSEYYGDGIFFIDGVYITPNTTRVQLIVQTEEGENLEDVLISCDMVNLSLPKYGDLLKAGSPVSLSSKAQFGTSETTQNTDIVFHDDIELPFDSYIAMNLTTNELSGNKAGKYDFIFKTNVYDNSLADMFRISLDGKIIQRSVYLGDGIYGLLNIQIDSGKTYRIVFWNKKEVTVNLTDGRIGYDGYPFLSVASYDDLSGNYDDVTNYSVLEVKKAVDGTTTTTETRDYNVYPMYPVWGHEYMYAWYEKIMADEPLKQVWSGDSTTLGSFDFEELRRHNLGKKIMTMGGYPSESVTTINSGHGTQHTGNWLGGDKDEDKRTENGFLDFDMTTHPDMDLYILGWGYNDGSNGHFPDLTTDERVARFEANLREGLERIRGSKYGRTPDDLAIIISTPNSTDSSTGVNPQSWHDRIRPIIQKACRDYKCAFVDIAARQYDHKFSSAWSMNSDKVHPNGTTNADYMSMFADLLFPYLMHK